MTNKLEEQDIFNQVAIHLINQNEKSTSFDGRCAYRGDNDLKCAVGCLITDDEYLPNMENLSIVTIVKRFSTLSRFSKFIDLLQDLQRIHDVIPIENWRDELVKVTTKYNLSFPNIE